MHLFGEFKALLSRHAGNGMCDDSAEFGEQIFLAQQRILTRFYKGSFERVKFAMSQECITLPREIDYLVEAAFCGTQIEMHSEWFEFLGTEFGSFLDGMPTAHMVPSGKSPVYRQPWACDGTAKNLLVLVEGNEDDLADGTQPVVRICGTDEGNREVFTEGVPGEPITISYGQTLERPPIYSSQLFHKVTRVIKPVTKNYVHLYAYVPPSFGPPAEDAKYWRLASWHPSDEHPMFSQIRIGTCSTDATADCIAALARPKITVPVHDSDVIWIDNIAALVLVMQALRAEAANDARNGRRYMDSAKEMLQEELNSSQRGKNEVHFQDDFFPSARENLV